jgi:hypothetical protein
MWHGSRTVSHHQLRDDVTGGAASVSLFSPTSFLTRNPLCGNKFQLMLKRLEGRPEEEEERGDREIFS